MVPNTMLLPKPAMNNLQQGRMEMSQIDSNKACSGANLSPPDKIGGKRLP